MDSLSIFKQIQMTKINSKLSRPSSKLQVPSSGRGFTLIELLITIGIIALVSAFILAKFPDFSERIALERASRIVGLAIRDAQIRAMSIKEFAPDIFPAYGVHFDSSWNDKLVIFADLQATENQKYDYDPLIDDCNNECVQKIKITSGVKIKALCANLKSTAPDDCALSAIDAVFKRPDPLIFLKGNGGAFSPDPNDVEIILQSPSGKQKKVGVWLNGQVFTE